MQLLVVVPCLWDTLCPCPVVPGRWQSQDCAGWSRSGVRVLEPSRVCCGAGVPGVPCSREPLGTGHSRFAGLPAPSSGTRR